MKKSPPPIKNPVFAILMDGDGITVANGEVMSFSTTSFSGGKRVMDLRIQITEGPLQVERKEFDQEPILALMEKGKMEMSEE